MKKITILFVFLVDIFLNSNGYSMSVSNLSVHRKRLFFSDSNSDSSSDNVNSGFDPSEVSGSIYESEHESSSDVCDSESIISFEQSLESCHEIFTKYLRRLETVAKHMGSAGSLSRNTVLHAFCFDEENPTIYEALPWILEEKDLDINVQNCFNHTPLFAFCERGIFNSDLFRTLLDHGAKINHFDRNGQNALHFLFRKGVLNFDLVCALVEAGIDINAKDIDGCTPLTLGFHQRTLNAKKDAPFYSVELLDSESSSLEEEEQEEL